MSNHIFSVKYSNLQLRSVDKHLTTQNKQDRMEIVQWSKTEDRCWTIAYFEPSSCRNYFNLRFVGKRPLSKLVNWKHFKKAIKRGHKLCKKLNK